jgi:hypothetical protein
MTGKRNERELLWFQTGGALNFITAVPHCGELNSTASFRKNKIIREEKN